MNNWESLIIERAEQRNQPNISDLLEIYGSYTELRDKLQNLNCKCSDSSSKQESEKNDKSNLEYKLLELQEELTNSYRNKLNFDNSINDLKIKIETLEVELNKKDIAIRKLKKIVQDLQTENNRLLNK